MVELEILNDKQLRELVLIIYYQEAEGIKNIKFDSETEVAKYLGYCQSNYESVLRLLDDADDLVSKHKDDKTKSPIAHDIYHYVVYSVNIASQCTRNCTLRRGYLFSIRKHSSSLSDILNKLGPQDVTEAEVLALEASQMRNLQLDITREHQSPASRNYSKWLKEDGKGFDWLVEKYKIELFNERLFEDLTDAEKLQVYGKVIEASGRGNSFVNNLSDVIGVGGIALLLFSAGLMVWDIFSSEHILRTSTRDAVVSAASFGGAQLGEIIVGALTTTELLAGIGGSAFLFFATAGIASGILGAFIFGESVGWLFDLIFGSGGSAPLPPVGHRYYVATMPDGETLARQIAHQDSERGHYY